MKKSESRKKLLELTKYIITRAEGDVFLGSIKLNKILYLSDFLYFRENGKNITGQDYIHDKLGPVAIEMPYIKRHYEKKQFVTVWVSIGPDKQRRMYSLKKPNLDWFKADMIAFVDRIIDVLCLNAKVTGTDISEVSHHYFGWASTKMGEIIPYETIFLANTTKQQKVTLTDRVRAEQIINTLNGRYGIDKKTQSDVITLTV